MSDYTNKDIVERLDQLIAIMKLANKNQLDAQKEIISKDDVSQAILEILESGPMDYSTLAVKTTQKTGKSEINSRELNRHTNPGLFCSANIQFRNFRFILRCQKPPQRSAKTAQAAPVAES